MAGNRALFDQKMQAGNDAAWQQDWNTAIDNYMEAIREFPGNTRAVENLALVLYQARRYDDAYTAYTRLVQLNPNDVNAQEKRAESLFALGQLKKAADLHQQAADGWIERRDLNKAVYNWNRAVTIDPSLVRVWNKLAISYQRMNMNDKAVVAYLEMANQLQKIGRSDLARTTLERARLLDGSNQLLLNALAALQNNQPIAPQPDDIPLEYDIGGMPDDVDPMEWLEALATKQGASEGFTTEYDLDVAEVDSSYTPFGTPSQPEPDSKPDWDGPTDILTREELEAQAKAHAEEEAKETPRAGYDPAVIQDAVGDVDFADMDNSSFLEQEQAEEELTRGGLNVGSVQDAVGDVDFDDMDNSSFLEQEQAEEERTRGGLDAGSVGDAVGDVDFDDMDNSSFAAQEDAPSEAAEPSSKVSWHEPDAYGQWNHDLPKQSGDTEIDADQWQSAAQESDIADANTEDLPDWLDDGDAPEDDDDDIVMFGEAAPEPTRDEFATDSFEPIKEQPEYEDEEPAAPSDKLQDEALSSWLQEDDETPPQQQQQQQQQGAPPPAPAPPAAPMPKPGSPPPQAAPPPSQPDPANSTYAGSGPGTGAALEEFANPQFSAFHPAIIAPAQPYALLVFVHIASVLDEIRGVAEGFKALMGSSQIRSSVRSSVPVARGTPLRLVPQVAGVTFSPAERVIHWQAGADGKSYVQETFLFQTPPDLNDHLRGSVRVYQGPLLIGEIPLTMAFAASDPQQAEAQIQKFDPIFASYSHKDTPIMEYFRAARQSMGQKMLVDIYDLRSGEHWAERLLEMIDESAVFQLFWSAHSAASPYCRQEWEYALKFLNERERFIQPVWWSEPMPPPPAELANLHFQRIDLPDHLKPE